MQAVADEQTPPPRFAGALEPVLAALLRKDPAARPDAAQAEQMLAEAAEGRRPRAAQEYVATRHLAMDGAGDTAGHAPPPGPAHTSGAAGGTLYQPAPLPPARRTRRRGRMVALVLVLAAVAGAAGAVALNRFGGHGDGADPVVAEPATSATNTQRPPDKRKPPGTVPDGWVRKNDPAGFSLVLPGKQWKRKVFDSHQTDYSPDGGRHFLRVAVDPAPHFDDPYEHQLDMEQQLGRLVDYKRMSLKANIYRDHRGSWWDYTWTALAKDMPFPGPQRAVEQMYLGRDGVEYALYMTGPEADWGTTREQFDKILRGWRPPSG
jgi:hypothetical protein